jgi:hypothetical protein
MAKPDYDDPDVEERWCEEQRTVVADYLRSQKVRHGRIGEWPAWHVAPCASIWAIESLARPEWIGWWVICGDLPIGRRSSRQKKSLPDSMSEHIFDGFNREIEMKWRVFQWYKTIFEVKRACFIMHCPDVNREHAQVAGYFQRLV